MDSTADGGDDYLREYAQAKPVPGLVLIVHAGQPAAATFAMPKDGTSIGRGSPQGWLQEDAQVSREHARISLSDRLWTIEDQASRNGSFVDAVRLTGSVTRSAPALLRVGRSLLWIVDDVRPFTGPSQQRAEGPILGGLSRRALGEIAIASKAGDTLLIQGESGAGKELLARAFHETFFGPDSKTPFIAVNCAAIPEGLAERLLFGAKRGAYSGATDAEGYLQEAHGGTLFLDEVAELDPLVQAKLLRVFETREVLPLGSSTPKKVQIRICAASHKDLRIEANEGRFRPDLYYRIGRPEVRIPPLRERLDEIPWLLQRIFSQVDPQLQAAVLTVEACALRPWPGNVRELIQEARRAAHAALHEGSDIVRPDHLSAQAGLSLAAANPSTAPSRPAPALDDTAIESALAAHGGNVTRAAKALGLHRNQLRRWLAKRPNTSLPPAPDEPDED